MKQIILFFSLFILTISSCKKEELTFQASDFIGKWAWDRTVINGISTDYEHQNDCEKDYLEIKELELFSMIDHANNCGEIERIRGTFTASKKEGSFQSANGYRYDIYLYSPEEEYYGLALYKNENSFGFEMLHRDEDGDGILDEVQFHFTKID